MQVQLLQLGFHALVHLFYRLPQPLVFLLERPAFFFLLQAFAVAFVQLADSPQPADRPGAQFRPTLFHVEEISSLVRPAEGQPQSSLLDVLHRLVRRIAVHHHDAARLRAKVVLRLYSGPRKLDHQLSYSGGPGKGEQWQANASTTPAFKKRVQRLMRLMGLEAIYRKPKLSAARAEHRIYPYLLRNVSIERPNQVWSTDITYVPL